MVSLVLETLQCFMQSIKSIKKIYLNKNSDSNISNWIELHLKNMNKNDYGPIKDHVFIQFQMDIINMKF